MAKTFPDMAEVSACIRTQHAAIERLTEDLAFVERWANHHGAKPHTTPKEALSVIQHYPPIKAITRSYEDGVVPDTFDPYAAIERKDALLKQALEAMAHGCPPDCKDGTTDSGGTYPWGEAVLMRCPTCETFDSITKELQ